MQGISDNISVMVRCRPLNEKERQEGATICLRVDSKNQNTLILDTKPDPKYFRFDSIATENTTQEDVFLSIGSPIANSCLEGYNCCIFAYGQTGAGKTYTIQGQGIENCTDFDLYQNEKRGIVPRVFEHLFSQILTECKQHQNIEYSVKCNFLEIYNEHIIDLLNPISRNLQIREDLKKGIYVEGLTEEPSHNYEETLELLRRGNSNRHIGSTNMNIESSRSHSVFSMTIESKASHEGIVNIRTSRFSFVDLAGSERQKRTSTTGERLKEGCNINRSLSVLGNVINALVDIAEGKTRHIHYRDSKLTFILRDSLGGNSKTAIIANVSPASTSFGETLSTLKFAQRAKLIQNAASINEDSTGTLESLKKEIQRQREELASLRSFLKLHELSVGDFKDSTALTSDLTSESLHKELAYTISRDTKRRQEGSSDMETILKQTLEILNESELYLKSELEKRDGVITQMKGLHSIYTKNDLQMRMIMKLQNSKIERYRLTLNSKFSSENLTDLLDFERIQLQKENSALCDILDSTPTIVKFFNDKKMKEKFASIISDTSATEDSQQQLEITNQLKEKIINLQELSTKLEESYKENKEENNYSTDYSSRQSASYSEESWQGKVDAIKGEYNEKIEQLNVELFDSERLLHVVHFELEKEKQENEQLKKELHASRQQRDKADEEYEHRISEMIMTFDQIKDTKLSLTEVERQNTELSLKTLEITEKIRQEQVRVEELNLKLVEKDEQKEQEKRVREGLEKQITELVETKLKDSLAFEQYLNELQIHSSILTRENEDYKKRIESNVADNESQKDLIQELEFNITEINGRYAQQIKIQEENNDELERKNAELNEQALELNQEIEEFKKHLNDLREQNSQIVTEGNQNAEKSNIITEQQNDHIEALKLKIMDLEKNNKETLDTNLKYKEEVNVLNKRSVEYEAAKAQLLKSIAAKDEHIRNIILKVDELETLVTDLQDTNQNLLLKISEKDMIINECKITESNAIERIEKANIQSKEISLRFVETKKTLEKSEKEISHMKATINEKDGQLAELDNEFLTLEIQLRDTCETLRVVQEDHQNCKEKLIKEQSNAKILAAQIEKKQEQIMQLEKEYTTQLEERQLHISQLEKQIVAQLEEKKEQIFKLEQKVSIQEEKKQEQILQLGQEVDTLKVLLKEACISHETLQKSSVGQVHLLVEKENELTKLHEEADYLSKIIESERKRYEKRSEEFIKEADRQVSSLHTKLGEFSKIQESLKEEKGDLLSRLEQQDELHREELENLELKHTEELHKLYEERKITLEQIARKKDTHLEEISNSYIQKLTELQNELNNSLTTQQKLEESLEEIKIANKELQKINTELKVKLNDVSKPQQASSRRQSDEIESLKKEINRKNDQLQEANHFVANCRSEIQEWKANIDLKNKELTNVCNSMQSMEAAMQNLRDQKRESWCDQENEIIEIKEQYIRLKQEHKALAGSVSLKDSQLRAMKEEIKDVTSQVDSLKEDLKSSRINETRLRKDNQELNEKITRLNNEQYLLLLEVESLNKAGDVMAGHMNNEQKIRHLNKLKEENSRLKDEKLRMAEDLLKAQEQRDKTQRRFDDIIRKAQSDPKYIGENENLKNELDKRASENTLYSDAFCKVIHLLQSGLSKEEIRQYNMKNYDIETVLHAVQSYSNAMMEKNKYIHNKETELESLLLKNTILEKEVVLLKQKIQLRQVTSSTQQQQTLQNQNPNIPVNIKSQIPIQQSYLPKSRSSSAKRTDSAERISYKTSYNDENREDFSKKPPRRSSGLFSSDKRY